MLFIAWGYFKKGKSSLSLVLSIGATLLALCFLLFGSIVDNEGGTSQPITGYRAGYWLWLLSIVTMMIGNGLIYLLKKPIDQANRKVISQS